MADPKDLFIRCKILGYWIDYSINTAYCVIEYLDFKQDDKHTNIFLLESIYNGN